MKERHEICERIPGGWHGNNPVPNTRGKGWEIADGVVVVASDKLMDAIAWLRRRASITRTATGPQGDGVLIAYRMRERPA